MGKEQECLFLKQGIIVFVIKKKRAAYSRNTNHQGAGKPLQQQQVTQCPPPLQQPAATK